MTTNIVKAHLFNTHIFRLLFNFPQYNITIYVYIFQIYIHISRDVKFGEKLCMLDRKRLYFLKQNVTYVIIDKKICKNWVRPRAQQKSCLHTMNFDHRDFFLSIHVEIDKLQSKKTSPKVLWKKSFLGLIHPTVNIKLQSVHFTPILSHNSIFLNIDCGG